MSILIKAGASRDCFDRGNVFINNGRYGEAITEYKKAIDQINYYGHYYCALSDAYTKNREYKKALLLWDAVKYIQLHRIDDNEAFIRPKRETVLFEIEVAKTHLQIARRVLPYVEVNPGVLQKDLYKQLSPEEKEPVFSMFWLLNKEDLITRVKKGTSYQLYMKVDPSMAIAYLDTGLNDL